MNFSDLTPKQMTKDEAASYRFFSRDPLIFADMFHALRDGGAKIEDASEEGVLLRVDHKDDIPMFLLGAVNETSAKRLIAMIKEPSGLVIRDERCFEAARAAGFDSEKPCFQVVYLRDDFPKADNAPAIRLMDKKDAELAASYYELYDAKDEFIQQIDDGSLFAAYDAQGTLLGYAGMHEDGSLGMLEVLPDYRRHNIGWALAAFMIRHRAEQGGIPYAQVFCDNTASINLQIKLGFEISVHKLLWCFRLSMN